MHLWDCGVIDQFLNWGRRSQGAAVVSTWGLPDYFKKKKERKRERKKKVGRVDISSKINAIILNNGLSSPLTYLSLFYPRSCSNDEHLRTQKGISTGGLVEVHRCNERNPHTKVNIKTEDKRESTSMGKWDSNPCFLLSNLRVRAVEGSMRRRRI